MPNFDTERFMEAVQIRKRIEEIEKTVYSQRRPIEGLETVVTGTKRYPERAPQSGWKKFRVGDRWGGLDKATWFRMRVTIPDSMEGRTVVALIRPRGEALAYVNGKPAQGIDDNHNELYLTGKAKAGETFEIALECIASQRFDEHHHFEYADIAVLNPIVWEFYWDCKVAYEVWEVLPENYAPRMRLMALLDSIVRSIDLSIEDEPEYHAVIARAQKALKKGLKEFETSYGMGHLTMTGHSHIDTAWLWPLRETERKVGRTFSTVLSLMDRYPEYHFSASQPVLYEFTKKNFPEVYAGIKRRAKEGRWEPCGAMWVEPDCNLPSGEAMVRQCVYGNRFYRKEFGVHSRIAWLPDVFGFTWSLPQILKKAQIDTFVTTKLTWSRYTKFPHSFFQWEGVDGTRVWGLMPPLNYNGNPVPAECIKQWDRFQQKDKVDEVPFSFGWGDGGGGPTIEMLEHIKRQKNIVGVPRCDFGRTDESVGIMKSQVRFTELPVWNGEIYLEFHRGCQTTQSRTKRNNRKSEVLLHDAEFLSTLALLSGGRYEQEALHDAWKIVLTNQFHDILPGSSITEVYTVADKDYARARGIVEGVRERAMAQLAKKVDTTGGGSPVLVVNTLPWVRDDVARVKMKLPSKAFGVLDANGNPMPYQKTAEDEILFETRGLPPLGYAVYRVVEGDFEATPVGPLRAATAGLENAFVRVKLDKRGAITSIYDKVAGREVLPRGARANVLQLFDDRSFEPDAWDFDHNFEATRWEPDTVSVEVAQIGPVCAVVRVVRATEKSTFTQEIVLHAHSPRIDFVTHADWWEKHVLMKVAFPVDVRASNATYEIQYGAIERPTHRNTVYDAAKFEVAAQRWADLSEGDYGVSLLNDCKYGYDTKENVLRLSLLRGTTCPDPKADEGEHRFTYSLLPHEGDWREQTVQEGLALNVPLLAAAVEPSKGDWPAVFALASVDVDNVILDHVKKAEDSKAVIVRLYEAHGQRGEVNVTFAHPPKSVVECDLMEENDKAVHVKGAKVKLYMTPFELRTLKVVF
ncbi:MAG: glycoside hydrolase family 38 C-terminal domain-containing protein [FCB group bacterium]|jgi:alpha-mannosidase|nr:glycoside hydrolase family 38 C-terminal domain-containing protein [FCB group bacterium]